MSPALSPLGQMLAEQARSYTDVAREAHRQGQAESAKRIAALEAALRTFVEAYDKHADPIGDSDLDREQPITLRTTLGAVRQARGLLR